MTDKTVLLLKVVLVVFGCVGFWMLSAPHWADLGTPQAIGGLLGQLATLMAGVFGISISLPSKK